jgi:hypothetical protein
MFRPMSAELFDDPICGAELRRPVPARRRIRPDRARDPRRGAARDDAHGGGLRLRSSPGPRALHDAAPGAARVGHASALASAISSSRHGSGLGRRGARAAAPRSGHRAHLRFARALCRLGRAPRPLGDDRGPDPVRAAPAALEGVAVAREPAQGPQDGPPGGRAAPAHDGQSSGSSHRSSGSSSQSSGSRHRSSGSSSQSSGSSHRSSGSSHRSSGSRHRSSGSRPRERARAAAALAGV